VGQATPHHIILAANYLIIHAAQGGYYIFLLKRDKGSCAQLDISRISTTLSWPPSWPGECVLTGLRGIPESSLLLLFAAAGVVESVF
jgi:hypothetical protein